MIRKYIKKNKRRGFRKALLYRNPSRQYVILQHSYQVTLSTDIVGTDGYVLSLDLNAFRNWS